MDEFFSLGVILLFALLAGHIVKFVSVPEVTGYILAGVLVGPSVFGWLTHENLAALGVFSEVALGLILFSVGSVFEFERFRMLGRKAAVITIVESVLAAALVTGCMLACGQPWTVALLLGVIAIETAAATTMMVIRECNSSGPLTETLFGVIALNNLLCLGAFSVVAAVLQLVTYTKSGVLSPQNIYASVYPLVWQIVGAVALGFLVGVLLAAWSSRVVEQGERLILLAGCVLLCVGLSHWLEVSPLVATLAVGATLVNLSVESRRLFYSLSHTDPPLYAIFFVIAGADINLALLPKVGLLGGVYVFGRTIGKLSGSWVSTRALGLENIRNLLGLSLLSQAGLSIGLVIAVNQRFPELAPTVSTVVLASVAVFELVGPLSAKFALVRSREVGPAPTLSEHLL